MQREPDTTSRDAVVPRDRNVAAAPVARHEQHEARVGSAGRSALAGYVETEVAFGLDVEERAPRELFRRFPPADALLRRAHGTSSSFWAAPAGPSLTPGAPPVPGVPTVPNERVAWPLGFVPL